MHTHTCAHSTPLHASANRTELQRHPPDSRVLSFHVLFLQSPRRQSSVQCRSGSGGQHGGCGEGSHRACFLPETIYRCGFKARTYAHTHTHTHTHQFFVKTLPCNYTYTAHARIKPEQLLARCTRDGGTRMGMSTTHPQRRRGPHTRIPLVHTFEIFFRAEPERAWLSQLSACRHDTVTSMGAGPAHRARGEAGCWIYVQTWCGRGSTLRH